jgi:hypothetical protein
MRHFQHQRGARYAQLSAASALGAGERWHRRQGRTELCAKAFIGAEPHSEETRRKIETLFGIEAYNSYGLSEMNGPGVAFECVYKPACICGKTPTFWKMIDPKQLATAAPRGNRRNRDDHACSDRRRRCYATAPVIFRIWSAVIVPAGAAIADWRGSRAAATIC